jgi:4-hydroxy-tetrahydrodipicolinate synthase
MGTFDTRHTVELALEAEKAGADGVLVVSPYYSRPPQDALEAHFREVADASGLPLVLYDIPGRTGTRIEPETMIRLAEHPRIVAVKDCSYDFLGTQKVLGGTELAYYTGCDEHMLALYAVGGVGLCEHGRERDSRPNSGRSWTRSRRATPPCPPASSNVPRRSSS